MYAIYHSTSGRWFLGQTVATIQKSLEPPHLHIDLRSKQALCGGTPVPLPPALLAWLAWHFAGGCHVLAGYRLPAGLQLARVVAGMPELGAAFRELGLSSSALSP